MEKIQIYIKTYNICNNCGRLNVPHAVYCGTCGKGLCECYGIVNEINKKYPKADWNVDKACKAWKASGLKGNAKPKYDYTCCCPVCGRFVCGWCA